MEKKVKTLYKYILRKYIKNLLQVSPAPELSNVTEQLRK